VDAHLFYRRGAGIWIDDAFLLLQIHNTPLVKLYLRWNHPR
jgi:hypothetical protein